MNGHNINEGVEDTTSPEIYLNATVDSGEPYSLDYPDLLVDSTVIAGPMTAGMYVYTAAPLKEIRFFYNADGLRTRKQRVLGGRGVETTDYILHGKLVTEMRRGSDVLHFFYDAQSRPAMVKYNGQMYTYVHNLQGDIVAIVDSSGAKVVEYRYDAWGRDIGRTLTSDIGELNPFRYRGYVYDEETELYYLRSRYYNAEIGRFLNVDHNIAQLNSLLSQNPFCYTSNLPLILIDIDGDTSTLYYYFGEDQYENAIANVIDLIKDDDYEVICCPVSSESEFEQYWNVEMMGDKRKTEIDGVIINLHGSIHSVNYMELDKLKFKKSINTLVLLSCNVGHMSGERPNFSETFMDTAGDRIQKMVAVDGTHVRGIGGKKSITAVADDTWQRYAPNSNKKSMGFVLIQHCSLGGYDYSSLGSHFESLKKLLRKVGLF